MVYHNPGTEITGTRNDLICALTHIPLGHGWVHLQLHGAFCVYLQCRTFKGLHLPAHLLQGFLWSHDIFLALIRGSPEVLIPRGNTTIEGLVLTNTPVAPSFGAHSTGISDQPSWSARG